MNRLNKIGVEYSPFTRDDESLQKFNNLKRCIHNILAHQRFDFLIAVLKFQNLDPSHPRKS